LDSLSSGRYSFDFDKDEFVVVDHWNADEPRPVATLSGGESFLASLALALALAEGLSGLSHGRSRFALESLFLDEGFGSLDPETLDVAIQGIETLGSSDRLVGIVSHIPEFIFVLLFYQKRLRSEIGTWASLNLTRSAIGRK
jgi:exonuclease SbcC